MEGHAEFEPECPVCGSSMWWEDCETCGGAGGYDGEELMEQDPLWYDEDDWENCQVCDGAGGWWICLNVKNHPSETVSAARPDGVPSGHSQRADANDAAPMGGDPAAGA